VLVGVFIYYYSWCIFSCWWHELCKIL